MAKIGSEGEDAIKISDRAENMARYWRIMQPQFDAELQEARGDLVKRFRANPRGWPEIDTKYDRWYRAEEWADDGRYIGPGPCVRPLNPDAMINSPSEKAAKLAAARCALIEVEERLGVTGVVSGQGVTLPITEAVMSPPGGEIDHSAVSVTVTLSAAALRQKAYRERMKAKDKG